MSLTSFAPLSIVDEGLGNSSYLVDVGDGRALVIDPSRDPGPYLALAERQGVTIGFAAETHLHADFISGSLELGARGATILGSAKGDREFGHRALEDGDEVDLGGLTLRVLATPGHTLEHVAYLILDGARPLALFTGGSLLVGAVARTDLISPERTEELARVAYRSIFERLLTLPDDLPVFPTHGAGSFCSAAGGGERTTTIGRERRMNPLLVDGDEDTFVARLLDGLGTYPDYFRRLAEVNRRGPRAYGGVPALTSLRVAEARRLADAGAAIIDARPIAQFATGHIPGAISIALRPAFASWLGWLVDPDQHLVFILDSEQDRSELVRQALNIGFENLAGELAGGMVAWRRAGHPETRIGLVEPQSLPPTAILDVRQESEHLAGHIPGVIHVELGSLASATGLPQESLALICEHGERAMSGASILERAGHRHLSVVSGGTGAWGAIPGNTLISGR